MNPVTWLQSLLHSISLTTILVILGYLVAMVWVMALMKAAAQADRRAEGWLQTLRAKHDWQRRQANSLGPQVTAATLIEEQHTNKDKETTE